MFEASESALMIVTIVGAATAIFAATVGLVQLDIKRVIAYSTCSQLGYMFFAAGVGAYGAAMFHLFTHAFFKALLFLGAGSVIHAMHHEQDMRYYGGLRKHIPITFWTMLAGTLAITGVGIVGVGGFAGFWSKDAIIEAAFAAHSGVGQFAFWIGVSAALLTSFYSWRLMFLTFWGTPRWIESEHIQHSVHKTAEQAGSDTTGGYHPHESPWVMLVPLLLLTCGALLAGQIFHDAFIDAEVGLAFWAGSLAFDTHLMHELHEVPLWVKLASTIAMLTGLGTAAFVYLGGQGRADAIARAFRPLYLFFFNKWYFDELYNWLFVRPAFALGRLFWRGGDEGTIDRFGPNGIAAVVASGAGLAKRLQSGLVYNYALVMLLGLTGFATWIIVRSAG
jgi:NADH-quinone oxidoreductase subunit L